MNNKIQKFNKFINEQSSFSQREVDSPMVKRSFIDSLEEMGYDPETAEVYYEIYSTISDADEFIQMSPQDQEEAIQELENI